MFNLTSVQLSNWINLIFQSRLMNYNVNMQNEIYHYIILQIQFRTISMSERISYIESEFERIFFASSRFLFPLELSNSSSSMTSRLSYFNLSFPVLIVIKRMKRERNARWLFCVQKCDHADCFHYRAEYFCLQQSVENLQKKN